LTACNCGHQNDDEKQKEFGKLLNKYKGKMGALIPLLQESQEIFGFLSADTMKQISASQGVPFSKTFGVATFYAQFHLKPRGRNIIRVCQGTACHVRGVAKVFDQVQNQLGVKEGETTGDLRYTLETVACIGACGLAPAMMVNDETHGRLDPAKAAEILKQYE